MKGSDFERQQCRQLSLWWTEGKRDDVFWRNRTRSTSKSPDASHQLGDIVAVDPIGAPFTALFNVELKRGYSKTKAGKKVKNIPWDLLDLIDGRGNPWGSVLIKFWEQVETDAILSGRYPLLIFRRDYHQPAVCLAKRCYLSWEKYCGFGFSLKIEVEGLHLNDPLVLFSYDEFFTWLTPDAVKARFNEVRNV
jgi:hypothetical protein